MAQQIIDVGNVANDGTGDPLRTAFQIVNENFSEVYNPSYLANGSSRVDVAQDGDIYFTSNGVANVMVVSSTQVSIKGDLAVTGNAILSGNILGDRIQNGNTIIDIQSPGGNANITIDGATNVAVFAPTGEYINGLLSVLGGVTGYSVTTVDDGDIGGNLLVSGSFISAVGDVVAANLLTGGLISAVGNITGSNIITGGNVLVTGVVSATGNIIGANVNTNKFVGNSASISGSVNAGNLLTTGLISATGTISTSANVVASVNVIGGNILTGGVISATGNVTASEMYATAYFDSDDTSYYANIAGTSRFNAISATGNVDAPYFNGDLVGNVFATSISVSGNITGGNLLTGGILSATSNIFAHDIAIGSGNTGNAIIYGNLTVYGNTTTIESNVITTNDLNITVGNNQNTGAALNGAGLDVGNNDLATWHYNDATTSWQTNLPITPDANASHNLGGPANYWNTGYLTTLSVAGNVSSNRVLTILMSASGNVVGANVLTIGRVSAIGNIAGGNLLTGGVISATGNVTGGNIITAGLISAATLAGSDLSVTGNVDSGNVNTGLISATGNIIGNTIIVSGSGGNITGANNIVATSNISGGNLSVSGNISAGNLSLSGNIVATNIGNITSTNFDGNISNVLLGTGVWGNTPATLGALNYIQNSVANSTVVYTTDTLPFIVVSANLSTNGNPVQVIVTGDAGPLAAGNGEIQLYRDSTAIGQPVWYESSTVSENFPYALQVIDVPPSDGTYTYSLKVNSLTANTQFGETNGPVLSVTEMQNVKGADGSPYAWRTIVANGTSLVSQESQGTLTYTSGNNLVMTGNATSNVVTFAVADSPVFIGNVTGGNLFTSGLVSTSGNVDGGNINGNLYSTIISVTGNATIGSYTPNALVVNGQTYIGNSAIADSMAGTGLLDVAAATTPNVVIRAYNQTTSTTLGAGLNYIRKQQTGYALTAGLDVGRMRYYAVQPNNDTLIYMAGVSAYTAGSGTDGELRFYTGLANTPQLVLNLDSSKQANFYGAISAAGNIAGSYISGNGSQLTGINVSNITFGTSNVSIVSSGGNVSVGVGGTSNVAVFSTSGEYITGLLSVTGNVNAGNVVTGIASVTSIAKTGSNAVGNIGSATNYFNQVFATATTALYADLAEKYAADADYTPGTVVSIGGSQEVTLSTQDGDRKAIGVVSSKPSYVMNAGLESEFVATVALTGRVPCRVQGLIRRGDLLVSAGNGRARAELDPRVGSVIGKALADFDGDEGVIEIVVGKH